MIETENPSEVGRVFEINSKLAKINQKTENDEKGGVILFDHEVKSPSQEKANAIFDNLMITLQNLGEEAAGKALSDPSDLESEQILQEVLDAAVVLRSFSDREIVFDKNREFEERKARNGDRISAFSARYALLDGKPYDVDLMIRSKPFERLSGVGKDITFEESREPRMRFDITPHQSDDFTITIRIDPDKQITFDIILKNIDKLDFKNAGQERGHHFPSGLSYQDSRATFSDTLETIIEFVPVKP